MRSDDPYVAYEVRTGFRMARHLQRRDEIAAAIEAADLDDLRALLGHRPATAAAGESASSRRSSSPTATAATTSASSSLFHRRNLRAHMLLDRPGSAMTRHLPIQPIFGEP